jgi:hypothetical protein
MMYLNGSSKSNKQKKFYKNFDCILKRILIRIRICTGTKISQIRNTVELFNLLLFSCIYTFEVRLRSAAVQQNAAETIR